MISVVSFTPKFPRFYALEAISLNFITQKEGKVVNIQLPPISVWDALVTVGFARGFYVLQGMAENRVT